MRRWIFPCAAALFGLSSVLAALAARAEVAGVTAHGGTVYEMAKAGLATQGFVEIDNSEPAADTLIGAHCAIADLTSIVDASGTPIAHLPIAAGATLLLSARGPHILLQSTHFSIDPGGAIPCSLTFRNAGDIMVYLYPIPAP